MGGLKPLLWAAMERYLQSALREDLHRKILLVTGPRQCGKTTLARMLVDDAAYFNYDLAEHRQLLAARAWDRRKALVIFDELHKMTGWKSWLKGTYDVEGIPPGLLVTGSANFAAFRKTGDSLAGRHFQFRLHPLDLREAVSYARMRPAEALSPLVDGRRISRALPQRQQALLHPLAAFPHRPHPQRGSAHAHRRA